MHCPAQLDAAVNKALRPLAKGKKKGKEGSAAAEGAERGDNDDEDEGAAAARKVLEFVTGALDSRSAHKPLPGASVTLAHALDAPSAELRRTVRPHCNPICPQHPPSNTTSRTAVSLLTEHYTHRLQLSLQLGMGMHHSQGLSTGALESAEDLLWGQCDRVLAAEKEFFGMARRL